MSASTTKTLVRAFWAIAALAFVITVVWVAASRTAADTSTAAHPKPAFAKLICDDAYQSEVHYEKQNPPYIDVKLKDGCFSGFVGLPDKWGSWQGQLLGNDPTDWMAEWYQGTGSPMGPWTEADINAGTVDLVRAQIHEVRLEGKGTVRFYRLVGDTK